MLPNPNRFKLMLVLGWFAKPFRNMIAKMGFHRIAAAIALVPPGALKLKILKPKSSYHPAAPQAKRVALMLGCQEQVQPPQINRATIRLLRRHRVDVMVVKDEAF